MYFYLHRKQIEIELFSFLFFFKLMDIHFHILYFSLSCEYQHILVKSVTFIADTLSGRNAQPDGGAAADHQSQWRQSSGKCKSSLPIHPEAV